MSGSGDTSQICSITTRCTWHMIALNKVVKLISQYACPIDFDVFNAFLTAKVEQKVQKEFLFIVIISTFKISIF